MDYWAETMQDDVYLIAPTAGWRAAAHRGERQEGGKRDRGWACDLVPKPFVVARYFARQQAALDATQAELEAATARLAELKEEHGGEEGYLGALDRVAKAEVSARLREVRGDRDAREEADVLRRWLELSESEATLKRAVREQEAALDRLAYEKYPTLSEDEVGRWWWTTSG